MVPLVEYADRHDRLGALFDRSASFGEEARRAARDVLAEVQSEGDETLLDLSEFWITSPRRPSTATNGSPNHVRPRRSRRTRDEPVLA